MATDFKKDYLDWLYENIDQVEVQKNVYRITFPYLDRNNDHIEIYIQVNGEDNFTLTDDGETINELEFSGMNVFSSDRRSQILRTILNAHGITMDEKHSLCATCKRQDLTSKKHMLAQCMIKISDMFYLSRPNTQSLFIEDVKQFFDHNEIYGMADISFSGKSGLTTTYDFGIPRSKVAPERLIKVVNNLDVTKAGYITFLWGDTKETRPMGSQLYVFIQDTDRKVSQSALNTMQQYQIRPVLWSERTSVVQDLIA